MKETLFFLEIQRERLAVKVQPGEARFGPELDGEKLWRHQVFRARMREKNGRKLFFPRDSEAAFGSESATRGGSFWTRIRWGKSCGGARCSELGRTQERKEKGLVLIGIQRGRLGAKVRPGEARFGPELDWEKPWLDPRMREKNGRKL